MSTSPNSPVVINDTPLDIGRPVISIAELLGAERDDSDLPDALRPLESADLRRLDRAAEADRLGTPGVAEPRMARVLADHAATMSC